MGSIPGSGKYPGGGHGNAVQYSCLGNPTDRGAWQGTVHGVTRVKHNWTQHSKRKNCKGFFLALPLTFYILEWFSISAPFFVYLQRWDKPNLHRMFMTKTHMKVLRWGETTTLYAITGPTHHNSWCVSPSSLMVTAGRLVTWPLRSCNWVKTEPQML